MLTPEEIKDIFAGANAIITGDHFVYAQKPDGHYHGYDYVNKDAIYPDTDATSNLCREIARHFICKDIDVVVGPTVGGVALAQWVTHWLKHMPEIIANHQRIYAVCADEEDVLERKEIDATWGGVIKASGGVTINCDALNKVTIEYSEKVGTRRIIKRGYDKHVKGKRCLIVEDVINSGATVAKTRDAIIVAGGEIVGVGCLCNRSGGKVTAETLRVAELFSLLDVNMQMFKEKDCPICKERGRGSVRLDLGKGKEFLARVGINQGDK